MRIQRHILKLESLPTKLEEYAADVNDTGSISALDLVVLRRLILRIIDNFAPLTSWRFYALQNGVYVPADLASVASLQGDAVLLITAVKLGDTDYSADRGK